MRRIAIINQKGGVGKTTTAVNLGAALARLGRRVVVIDMDPQANASMNLGAELGPDEPSTYSILTQGGRVADTLSGTSTPGLSVIPAHLDLSGAELELASAIGRETILRDALDEWEDEEIERTGRAPADVVLIDNPPSLGLLSVNGLAASKEVLIAVQTEFFALQGLSKLVEIVQLLRRRMNPDLEITGVLACLYDSRLRLAREVLGELRTHFPGQVFRRPIAQNVKLAETPSFGRTIFEYAPESKGAEDYLAVAREFLEREGVTEDGDGRAIESASEPGAADADAGSDGAGEPPAGLAGDREGGVDAGPEGALEAGPGAAPAADPGAESSGDAPETDAPGEEPLAEVDVPAAARPPAEAGGGVGSVSHPGAGAPPAEGPGAGDSPRAPEPSRGPSRGPAREPAHGGPRALDAPGPHGTAGPDGGAEAPSSTAVLAVEDAETDVDPGPAISIDPVPDAAPERGAGPALDLSPDPGLVPEAGVEPVSELESAHESAHETSGGTDDTPGAPGPVEVTPAPRLRTPVRTRRDDRGEERPETPGRRTPAR